jgi:hypothetical protein
MDKNTSKQIKPTIEATCHLFMHAEILRQLWLSSHEMACDGKSAHDIAESLRIAASEADKAYRSALAEFKA